MKTETGTDQSQLGQQIRHWSFASRVAFRFCFVYFGLYCLVTQIFTSLISPPSVEIRDASTLWPTRQIVLWTATHIFRVAKPLVYTDTGSGDKTFDWVLVACLLVFAGLATGIWSVLDHKRENYIALHKWFRLTIRFFLGGQMITYGLAKVVPSQMPFPFLTRLLEPFGNFSPMGVLWSAIGSSPAYEIFAGCAEMLGGILLIIPSTTTLGALVCLADMIQVFMLNMTYDVPVKLLSLHLILLALFLLAPDLKRLLDFFFLNRSASPSTQPALFASSRANRIAFAAQIIFGLWLLGINVYGSWVIWHAYGDGRPKSALYGIWEVDQQSIDGEIRLPLLTDPARWRRVIFDFPDRMAVQRMDDSFARYGASIRVLEKTLELTDDDDKNWRANFTFERAAPERLTLDGNMNGHQTHLQLKLADHNKFLLVERRFQWIQEYPFNR